MSVTPFAPKLPPVAPTGAAVPTGPGAGNPAAAGFAALVAGLLAGPTAEPVPADAPTGDAEETPSEETGKPLADLTGFPVPTALAPPVVPVETPGPTAATTSATTTGGPEVGLPADQPSTTARAEPTSPVPQAVDGPAPAGAGAAAPTSTTALPVTAPTTGAPAPAHAPAPAATPPVTRQVIPEITRLVSQGDGTHRLTMTLRPEALGEVRVTLTVRDGEVHVRFAAGDEAQRALIEGAPELRRVLELAGAGDTRVVVRDLAQPAAAGTPQTTPSLAASGGEGRGDTATTGHGRGEAQDQHAGTRGGTTARDGLSDGAHPPRPEPDRHARSSGVDLTM